jgi:hypothetical protein
MPSPIRLFVNVTDADHDHNVWIEADDITGVTVTTYTTYKKSQWWSLNRWQTIWTLFDQRLC